MPYHKLQRPLLQYSFLFVFHYSFLYFHVTRVDINKCSCSLVAAGGGSTQAAHGPAIPACSQARDTGSCWPAPCTGLLGEEATGFSCRTPRISDGCLPHWRPAQASRAATRARSPGGLSEPRGPYMGTGPSAWTRRTSPGCGQTPGSTGGRHQRKMQPSTPLPCSPHRKSSALYPRKPAARTLG